MDGSASPPVCEACSALILSDAAGTRQLCLGCLLSLALCPDDETAPLLDAGLPFAQYRIDLDAEGVPIELGRGAMGVTYRATDTTLHRPVALKVVNPGMAHQSRARARFLREAQAAAGLRHPHVASVFFFGERAGRWEPFYAMELVEGETLQARVSRAGGLPVSTVLEIGVQMAGALAAAEARGLIHRDLKPANVMLVHGGSVNVKVIDFGLAKAAADSGMMESSLPGTEGFIGTPAFASPEQFRRGETVDARSDFYTLGATLWYALTGRAPFAGSSLAEIHERQLRDPLPLAQLRAPRPMAELLRALLSPDPAGRPQTASELTSALNRCRAQVDEPARHARRRTIALMAAIAGLTATLAVTLWMIHSRRSAPAPAPPPALEKSVAVLPFDNFSPDKDSAFFADGVQDEILTDLAKVADLKVISRTSVMQYKSGGPRNLREIAAQLGVAHVVEGSVQRVGNKIRVRAQLIDARTDTHQWAEHYDRELTDVFAMQSEIAQAIAGQLQAAISPQEQAEMQEVPTHDEQAYQLYLRAVARWNDWDNSSSDDASTSEVMSLLRQATTRDPGFARAYVFMIRLQAIEYYVVDPSPANETAFRENAETVARLRPGSADANLAMGVYDYYGRRDYARAHDEFTAVVRQSPNDAWAYEYLGMIERHHAQWKEAEAHLRRALELDPENNNCYFYYGSLLEALGRYPESLALTDRRIALHPKQYWLHIRKSWTIVARKADTAAARAELALLPPGFDPQGGATGERIICDEMDRDFAAAARELAACPLTEISGQDRPFYQGDIARYRGDAPATAAAYKEARALVEAFVAKQPNDAGSLLDLARLDALLGRKEAALAEGRRALPLVPDDTLNAPPVISKWAQVLAFAGERDEAIRVLQTVCGKPFGPDYGSLHSSPDWDALRGDPRFQALVASLAPKP